MKVHDVLVFTALDSALLHVMIYWGADLALHIFIFYKSDFSPLFCTWGDQNLVIAIL